MLHGHLDASDDWQAPITYPTITDDGADPVVWQIYNFLERNKISSWTTLQGWEATKSNDESETPASLRLEWHSLGVRIGDSNGQI